MLKPTFSSTFKKKIHILNKNEKLGDYLMDGYQEYLPDEFLGWKSTTEMAIDYCDIKRHEERQRQRGATIDKAFDISGTCISI